VDDGTDRREDEHAGQVDLGEVTVVAQDGGDQQREREGERVDAGPGGAARKDGAHPAGARPSAPRVVGVLGRRRAP
jgi:hypothetical protein